MGWDAGLNRKLAVPLALGRLWENHENRMERSRRLRETEGDPADLRVLMRLADNRVRLEKLKDDIENDSEIEFDDELQSELEYIDASVQLGLLEIAGELEEIQTSEDLLEQAVA